MLPRQQRNYTKKNDVKCCNTPGIALANTMLIIALYILKGLVIPQLINPRITLSTNTINRLLDFYGKRGNDWAPSNYRKEMVV